MAGLGDCPIFGIFCFFGQIFPEIVQIYLVGNFLLLTFSWQKWKFLGNI